MKNMLLKLFLVCVLFFCCQKNAWAQELSFQYDAAGNQIIRQFICINCAAFPAVSTIPPAISAKLNGPSKMDSDAASDSKIVAYPNPLNEILNIRWNPDKFYIKTIEVFSLSGATFLKQNIPYSEGQSQTSISFSKMVPGMYAVKVTCSDGRQEIIKVVKL